MNLTKPFCRPCGKEVHPTAAEACRSIRSYARKLKGNSGQRKTPVDAYACPSGTAGISPPTVSPAETGAPDDRPHARIRVRVDPRGLRTGTTAISSQASQTVMHSTPACRRSARPVPRGGRSPRTPARPGNGACRPGSPCRSAPLGPSEGRCLPTRATRALPRWSGALAASSARLGGTARAIGLRRSREPFPGGPGRGWPGRRVHHRSAWFASARGPDHTRLLYQSMDCC
jgi:hypothetical protein